MEKNKSWDNEYCEEMKKITVPIKLQRDTLSLMKEIEKKEDKSDISSVKKLIYK